MDRALVAAAVISLVAVAAALLRRRSPRAPGRVAPADVGLDASRTGVGVVGFSTPLCLPCRAWEAALAEAGVAFSKVDVSSSPELAHRYGISATPLILALRLPDGEVMASFRGEPREGDVERLATLASS